IEIGCGGTLRRLAASVPGLTAELVLATGSEERLAEARHSAELFLPGCAVLISTAGLPDGRLPAHWDEVKELLEESAGRRNADLVLAPRCDDAHQDHRTVAELVPTVWRDHLVLGYEIPKWDGDVGNPSLYVSLTAAQMREKVEFLHKAYPSQSGRDWFDVHDGEGDPDVVASEGRPVSVPACRGCDSAEVVRVVDLGDQPGADHFPPLATPGPDPRWPLELWLCESCTLG
ncbi:MAG: hypothetical protein GEV00_23020, partial [Actinophytocola sp.]|nr:hypothetical protein [Actinophytocola sp.]